MGYKVGSGTPLLKACDEAMLDALMLGPRVSEVIDALSAEPHWNPRTQEPVRNIPCNSLYEGPEVATKDGFFGRGVGAHRFWLKL